MRVSILLLTILTIGTIAQDTEVVIQLLSELRQEAVEQLALLDLRFKPIKEAKLEQINAYKQAIQDQNGECYNRNSDVENKQIEIDLANDYKSWMRERQGINSNRIGVLSTNVCEKNNNYLNNVKNARVLLRLIAYLRASLQSQLQSSSYVEVKESTVTEISHMVQAYKEYRRMNMLQMNQEEFELNGTIEQLIELLNQMEKEIQADVANGQNGQVQVGVTFSEFKIRIEKENDVFNRQIEVQDDLITHFQNQLTTLFGRVDKCQARLKELQYTLLVAEEDLRYDQEGVDEDRLSLEEEIELFDWLIKHYQIGDLSEDGAGSNADGQNPDGSNADGSNADGSNADGSNANGSNGSGSLNDRDGVIDYTPLKEVSHAWSSEADDEDSHNTSVDNNHNVPEKEDRGDVIDYTPLDEHSESWDAFLQRKQKSHKSKKHAHKK